MVETQSWTAVTGLAGCASTTIPATSWHKSQVVNMWCERDVTRIVKMSLYPIFPLGINKVFLIHDSDSNHVRPMTRKKCEDISGL